MINLHPREFNGWNPKNWRFGPMFLLFRSEVFFRFHVSVLLGVGPLN